jgi:hypothetical protein
MDGAYLTVNRSEERRVRALRKAKAYGAAVGGAVCGYFAGTWLSVMTMGDFAGAELVAPRIRLGRLGWMPRANLITLASVVVFSAAGVAFAHPQYMTDPVLWPQAAASMSSEAASRAQRSLASWSGAITARRVAVAAKDAAHTAVPGSEPERR